MMGNSTQGISYECANCLIYSIEDKGKIWLLPCEV
uniref:Uncharacterized protein n=1 Tax=Arundo donax TaxID=35708 RepID=A0A0A9BL28_ARUDO